MTERRCVDCVNYRRYYFVGGYRETCKLERPLKPCPDYQREPGADDDKESSDD